MLSANDIRQTFLDFFKSKGHEIVPSAPIVVKNDPTLMFTNAGMNQFKDYFLGNSEAPNQRVCDTQKCLRVSGKHNDLEEVGVDTYHHTMFEMLGNWSFGDPKRATGGYFKKEAIAWSWELLTEIFKIPKDRLYVTIFEGDENEGIPKDEESYNFWKTVISEDRILLGNKKDNFWEMGDTGPCGPCTEIHVDCRSENERIEKDGKLLVNNDDPQVIEIWNNVFIQYNRMKDSSLIELPAKHVDTGMGLERLVRVLQNKTSNYDTDLFSPTIHEIEKISKQTYTKTDDKKDIAFRVLADHIRAISFTIADGQLPSNTGAGYVIRRILRRAVRYYYSYLSRNEAMLYMLVNPLAEQFSGVFPELKNQQDFVSKVIKEEEESFLRTLEKGLKRIDELVKNSIEEISGKDAFELYDTYGFPMDLTRLIAHENNLIVNEKDFEQEMKAQKDRSRSATQLETQDWIEIQPQQTTQFVGYESLESNSRILKYRQVDNKGKSFYQVVLDQTPFYAEGGGQVGDKGIFISGERTLNVFDVKKENDMIVHFVKEEPINFLNSTFTTQVNTQKRHNTAKNHSATHLLHAALRQVLGHHVAQKGSLVNDELLRFDFSHFAKVSDEEILEIEKIVNLKILESIPVTIENVEKEIAINKGAMALFGEKYGDKVRLVTMDPSYSLELCGGTHVNNTSEIGLFVLLSESSVAAGVRRIEAITGQKAMEYIASQMDILNQIKKIIPSKNIVKDIENLKLENVELNKKLDAFKQKNLNQVAQNLMPNFVNRADTNMLVTDINNMSVDDLKKIGFHLKSEIQKSVIVLSSKNEDKFNIILMMDESLQKERNIDLSKLFKEVIAPKIQGGGGGQKFLVSGSGKNSISNSELIDIINEVLV